MKQILIFGASIVHGLGGPNGGWADKLKATLHKEMFGDSGRGEVNEVYELGIPGQTMQDVLGRFESDIKPRIRDNNPENVYVIFSAGTNDSKAVDVIDNHVLSADDFAAGVHSFVHLVKEYSAHLLAVGLTPVDESKTSPKTNPINGKDSYFSNVRIKAFEETLQRTCDAEGVTCVPLFGQVPPDWQQHFVWQDGVHPNDAGHIWIHDMVQPELRALMDASA
jgi:lysophospholipase L1-like esterase